MKRTKKVVVSKPLVGWINVMPNNDIIFASKKEAMQNRVSGELPIKIHISNNGWIVP